MAVLVLLISLSVAVIVTCGIKGALALGLLLWCCSPLFEKKKLARSRVTTTLIIAATTALLWWKVGWLLAVVVGLVEVCAAAAWQTEKEERESLRHWASSLFED